MAYPFRVAALVDLIRYRAGRGKPGSRSGMNLVSLYVMPEPRRGDHAHGAVHGHAG
jgi:hypothetical protein